MTKIIEISRCGQCPYYIFSMFNDIDYCAETNKPINVDLVYEVDFPDWCPLPEKEEEPDEFLPDLKY